MTWQPDPAATALAKQAFGHRGCTPVVKKNGAQFLLEGTPYGLVELIPIGPKLLVAAQEPPTDEPLLEEARVPPGVQNHLERHGLHAWRLFTGPERELSHILRQLANPHEAPAQEPGEVQARQARELCSPYLVPLAPSGALVGDTRLEAAGQTAGLLRARGRASPAPAVIGPRGIGKRSLAAVVAGRMGLAAVELPLGRFLLVERVLQTPTELLLDTLLAGRAAMGDEDLLVVSESQLMDRLLDVHQRHVLEEMGRLPHVLFLSDAVTPPEASDLVVLRCPGLGNPREARRLVELHHPGVAIVEQAMEMLCRAAGDEAVGIIPGRLLYLVRLALSLVEGEGAQPRSISPDEAAPAIRLARTAWPAC